MCQTINGHPNHLTQQISVPENIHTNVKHLTFYETLG